MLTEAVAKTKWCPLATASHTDPRAGFNGSGSPKVFPCIGSECMAWQWFGFPTDDAWIEAVRKASDELGDKHPSRANAAKHVSQNRVKYGLSMERAGFCGAFARSS